MGNSAGYHKMFCCTVVLLCLLIACFPAAPRDDRIDRLILATCYTCHSVANNGTDAIPGLHGLSATDINELLQAYKGDQRQGTIMNRISKALTDAEIDRISTILGQPEH